jgi:hypothetical protein
MWFVSAVCLGRYARGPKGEKRPADVIGNADLTQTLWSMTDLADMIEATLPKPGPRGPYQKRGSDDKSGKRDI